MDATSRSSTDLMPDGASVDGGRVDLADPDVARLLDRVTQLALVVATPTWWRLLAVGALTAAAADARIAPSRAARAQGYHTTPPVLANSQPPFIGNVPGINRRISSPRFRGEGDRTKCGGGVFGCRKKTPRPPSAVPLPSKCWGGN